MATATKTATKEDVVKTATTGEYTDIRHMVRNLGPETWPEQNVWSYDDAERHIRETYFADGWELEKIIHLSTLKGAEQGGLRYDTVQLMYIFVRRATA